MSDTTANPTSNGKTGLSDALRTHFSGDAPLTQKASGFVKERPWASLAFAGIAAAAILNTVRGRR